MDGEVFSLWRMRASRITLRCECIYVRVFYILPYIHRPLPPFPVPGTSPFPFFTLVVYIIMASLIHLLGSSPL